MTSYASPLRHRATLAASLAAAAALAAVPAGAGAAKPVNVKCLGGGSSCSAIVSLAGGASNKRLHIALSDTDLRLVGIVAKPASVRGAYVLSNGKYSLGGSVFTCTLNAVKAIGKGSTLTLKFSSKGKAIKLKG